jgi:hypothetical protein
MIDHCSDDFRAEKDIFVLSLLRDMLVMRPWVHARGSGAETLVAGGGAGGLVGIMWSTGDTQLSRTPPSDHVLAQTLAQRRIVYVTLCQGVKGSIP